MPSNQLLRETIVTHKDYIANETLTTHWSEEPLKGEGVYRTNVTVDDKPLKIELRKIKRNLTWENKMPRPVQPRIGGSFAPPLSNELLVEYRGLAEAASPQVREIMKKLCDMVEHFYKTPSATLAERDAGTPHPSGTGSILPLKEEEKTRIFDVVPWDYECDMYGKVFDELPTGIQGEHQVLMEVRKVGTAQRTVEVKYMPQRMPSGNFLVPAEAKANEDEDGAVVGYYYQNRGTVVNSQDKAIRDAAFHLLWYAKELELDREPITSDMI